MKTIVVAADETEVGERALSRAADVAEAFGAHLVVLGAAETVAEPAVAPVAPPGGAAGGPVGLVAPLALDHVEAGPPPREVAGHRLEHARSRLAARSVDAEYVADLGEPVERLLELAEQRNADLIVVASGERGLLDRILGHDAGDRVAHRSRRDVLLVH